MLYFQKLRPLVIGMIHVPALPGSPGQKMNMNSICLEVKAQTFLYKSAGVDSIMIENMHDLPYVQAKDMGPETVAYMSNLCSLVRRNFNDNEYLCYQPQILTNSLQTLLRNLPQPVKESAENATFSKTFNGGNEVKTASFPNFEEIGYGKTELEARLKGILEICANRMDNGNLHSEEIKEWKKLVNKILETNQKFSEHKDPYFGCLQQYCNRKKWQFEFIPDNGDSDSPMTDYHAKLFINGKLVADGIDRLKSRAQRKCVTEFLSGKVGVQILAGANKEALAVAHSAGAHYIRAEGFVFSHVADEGWMDACAGPLLRYRNHIGANKVQIFTDIKKKHSAHAVTSDVDLVEMAKAAELFGSDGVIVTGTATGVQADPKHVQDVIGNVSIPVLVGSGVNFDNVTDFKNASAVIVGSHFKRNQHWRNPLNLPRLYNFMAKILSDEIDFDEIGF